MVKLSPFQPVFVAFYLLDLKWTNPFLVQEATSFLNEKRTLCLDNFFNVSIPINLFFNKNRMNSEIV